MPYDGSNSEVIYSYLNIEDFKAFCKSKGEEKYDYGSNTDCAICTYLKSRGLEEVRAGGEYVRFIGSEIRIPIPIKIQEAIIEHPRTYANIYKNLEA